uniref:Uncharacterized protein n=1 Tax=Rhizophora mucronata TaxID=61149 RepID=A0A2P2QHW3_RHIMU
MNKMIYLFEVQNNKSKAESSDPVGGLRK